LPTDIALPTLQLPTGVPGLDNVLGGGIPERSCTVIVGGPGTGKTTLAQQILFANAADGRSGVYFTGPAESRPKLIQHQQHLGFFESAWLNDRMRVVDLGEDVIQANATAVLETIDREIAERGVSFVAIDLVRALTPTSLLNDLAFHLAHCAATSLLVIDCDPLDLPPSPVLSTADAVLWLRQSLDREATVRTIQAPKVRGQQPLPGTHACRLTWDGLQVFPRWPIGEPRVIRSESAQPLTVGPGVDLLLGGGVPPGDAVLVDGASGAGKSVLAAQFVALNAQAGEPGAVFLFEERPDRFIARADALDLGLARQIDAGTVEVLSLRGRDMTADEVMHEVQRVVPRLRARCVVIDSLAGLDLALTAGRGVRDCMWRLLDLLSGSGVTTWLNGSPDLAHLGITSLVDDLVELRRVERDHRVEHELSVIKMRSSPHLAEARTYSIGRGGLRLIDTDQNPRRNGHTLGPRLALTQPA